MLMKFKPKEKKNVDKKQYVNLNCRLTKEENESLMILIHRYKANKSEFIRFLINRECELEGIVVKNEEEEIIN